MNLARSVLFLVCTTAVLTTLASAKDDETMKTERMPNSIRFLPDGRPASLILAGEERLDTGNPGSGFVLRVFDGKEVHAETLPKVSPMPANSTAVPAGLNPFGLRKVSIGDWLRTTTTARVANTPAGISAHQDVLDQK